MRAEKQGFELGQSSLSVWWVFIIFAGSLALRLINIAALPDVVAHAFFEDSPMYWEGAKAWLKSGYFARSQNGSFVAETERMPAYFLYLMMFINWLGEEPVYPIIGQCIIDSGTCVIVAQIGAMAGKPIGLIAGILAAIRPNLIIFSGLLLGDTLFLFTFSLILYFALKYLGSGKIFHAGMAGVFCGLAIANRSLVLFIPLAMALVAPIITKVRYKSWGLGIASGTILLLLAALPITNILVRNVSEFNTYQLTSQSGTHFLNWVVGLSKALASGNSFSSEAGKLNSKLNTLVLARGKSIGALTPFEISDFQIELALEEINSIHGTVLIKGWLSGGILNIAAPAIIIDPRVRALNSKSFMDSSGAGIFERARIFVLGNNPLYNAWLFIGVIGSVIALILQVIGLTLGLRRLFWPTIFGILAILYFLLVNGPMGNPKYRLPFEPVIIVFQSLGVWGVLEWLRLSPKKYRNRKLNLHNIN